MKDEAINSNLSSSCVFWQLPFFLYCWCVIMKSREGEPMPRKKADYSQGERWFLLYQYFIKNSNKDSPITFDDICKSLCSGKYDLSKLPTSFLKSSSVIYSFALRSLFNCLIFFIGFFLKT